MPVGTLRCHVAPRGLDARRLASEISMCLEPLPVRTFELRWLAHARRVPLFAQ
jgi:hypothetical protein